MEDFYSNSTSRNNYNGLSNITSQHDFHDHTDITPGHYDYDYDYDYPFYYDFYFYDNNSSDDQTESEIQYLLRVTRWIIMSICLPLTILAIYALYSLVQNDHVAPIYVINLLISDLIQMCCMIIWLAKSKDRWINKITYIIYIIGLIASLGFMVCVALERYLVITFPLWYRFRRTIKVSVVVSVVVWALSFVPLLFKLTSGNLGSFIILSILFLLPFPLLIFFLVGTLKALSGSTSVHSEEKRQILGTLVLVLLNYMLLFLPTVILYLTKHRINSDAFSSLSFILIQFSPLVDLVLYVFMRKGAIDNLLASPCCSRMNTQQE